ncbi:hypothetical protein H4J45_00865, partial [Colwellia sp. BRX10-6]|nr:hypothetical protein [Colwellia sp. BRX10-6]
TVVNHLDLAGIADHIELAGPGFINIHLDKSWLAAQLAKMTDELQICQVTKHQQKLA